jgi:hypothetical protein
MGRQDNVISQGSDSNEGNLELREGTTWELESRKWEGRKHNSSGFCAWVLGELPLGWLSKRGRG